MFGSRKCSVIESLCHLTAGCAIGDASITVRGAGDYAFNEAKDSPHKTLLFRIPSSEEKSGERNGSKAIIETNREKIPAHAFGYH
jgi:hypothetical protein